MERTIRPRAFSSALLALVVGVLALLVTAEQRPADAAPAKAAKCHKGIAGNYPCKNIDLKGFISTADIGGGTPSDVWGWRDPKTKREYALVGTSRGTAFVDVTNPGKPVFLGALPKPDRTFVWQDVEVYKNHAFVVCDLSPCGMQIFDMTRLRGVKAPQTWVPDLVYAGTQTTHSLDINPQTGFAYLNGNLAYANGSPHIVDVNDPMAPIPAGFNLDDGYTHDSLCRIYKGPDKKFRKKEVCFNFNEDTITIYDMTSKMMPARISRVTYKGAAYTHYGTLTKDHKYLVSNDELDEQNAGTPSTLFIWDVRNLAKPKLIGTYKAPSKAIDHNVYTKGRYIYHATYTDGVRIFDTKNIAKGKLREVAYFDVMPLSNAATFDGTWAAYPFLPSGNVLVGDMSSGLFIVRPKL
jgi:choice-of-anchor B domain-containing protein